MSPSRVLLSVVWLPRLMHPLAAGHWAAVNGTMIERAWVDELDDENVVRFDVWKLGSTRAMSVARVKLGEDGSGVPGGQADALMTVGVVAAVTSESKSVPVGFPSAGLAKYGVQF